MRCLDLLFQAFNAKTGALERDVKHHKRQSLPIKCIRFHPRERQVCLAASSEGKIHSLNCLVGTCDDICSGKYISMVLGKRNVKPLECLMLWLELDPFCYTQFNSFWPSGVIWWHRTGSPVPQIAACCLMAPSHYLNQCWLIVDKIQWHSSEGNCSRHTSAINC